MVQIQVILVQVVLKDNAQHIHLNGMINILHNYIMQMKMEWISWALFGWSSLFNRMSYTKVNENTNTYHRLVMQNVMMPVIEWYSWCVCTPNAKNTSTSCFGAMWGTCRVWVRDRQIKMSRFCSDSVNLSCHRVCIYSIKLLGKINCFDTTFSRYDINKAWAM